MIKLILAEKIHGVIQGEGINTGQKMVLIRVFGCPVKCKDCDSKQTWDTQVKEFDVKTFFKEIKKATKKFNTNHILLTGGEPGLYLPFMKEFFETYQDIYEWKWDIETAGIHDWSDIYEWESNIQFNISPKIGALYGVKDMEWKMFQSVPINYIVKVVTSKETLDKDIEAIKKLQKQYPQVGDSKIYLMPKGIDKKTILRETKWLIKKVFKLPYNFSNRVQILIYNIKKLV